MAREHTQDPAQGEQGTLWWLIYRRAQPLSLPEQIAARIGDRIVMGAIAPGAKVTEQMVSAEFEISRAPVREALRILERQHLIDIQARKGARAAPLTEQGVRDITEIRSALYRVIGRRLAGQGNADAIATLEAKARALAEFAEDAGGPDRYLWAALDLSISMAEASGNTQIAEILGSLVLQTYRYARLSALTPGQRQKTARMWRDSVRAMKRLDGDGAAETLVRIAEFARDQALRVLAGQPEAGADEA